MAKITSSVKHMYHSMLINWAERTGKFVTNYKAKNWISYGDSITASNGWQPAVAARLGLIHRNRGIGGTTIAETGTIAWVDKKGNYIAKPPATQPTGTKQILSSMCNSQRIHAMIPLDTQLLTIMGGTNDYGHSIPLGKGLPTNGSFTLDETTFIGALCSMVEKIQTKVPTCRIILMTPIPRYHEGRYEHKNRAGLLTYDYAKAVKDVAAFYSLPCIDLYSKVGWNPINGNLYLRDGIHPNTTMGDPRISEVVLGDLKAIEPLS